jgi:DNA-binding NarL/FixJ family response regulator
MRRGNSERLPDRTGTADGPGAPPGELGVALRLVRGLLDDQLETTREIEAIMVRLERAWSSAREPRAAAGKLAELLTSQESRVLQQIFLGRTNRQIAKILGITEKTTQNYVQSVFRKLHVHSRTEAVLVAVRNQWFEADVRIAEPRSGGHGVTREH